MSMRPNGAAIHAKRVGRGHGELDGGGAKVHAEGMAGAAASVMGTTGEDERRAAPRRAGRPSASEARNKHEAMLEAALEEFSRHGFHGASVRAIAERAGLSTRTLYNRYPDKVALFAASLEQSALQDAAAPIPRHSDLRDELVRFARHILNYLSQDRRVRLARVIFRECTSFPQLEPIARRQYERLQLEPTEEILVRHGIDPAQARDLAAFYVAMVFNRWQTRVIYDEPLMSPAEVNRHIDGATDLFLNGVLAAAKG